MSPSPDPRTQQKGSLHPLVRGLLRYGGSAIVLILLFRFLPGRQILQTLETLPVHLCLLVVVSYLVTHCLGVGKWRLMVNTSGADLNYLRAANCYFAGLFGSLVLPSLIGGDLVRAALAMRYERAKPGVLPVSVIDRIVDFVGLILLAIVGAVPAPPAVHPQSRRVFVWFAAAGVAGAVNPRIAGNRHSNSPAVLLCSATDREFAPCGPIYDEASFHRPYRDEHLCGVPTFLHYAESCPRLRLRSAPSVPSLALCGTPGESFGGDPDYARRGRRARSRAGGIARPPFGAPPSLSVAAGLAWEAIVIAGAIVAGAFALISTLSVSKPHGMVGSVDKVMATGVSESLKKGD